MLALYHRFKVETTTVEEGNHTFHVPVGFEKQDFIGNGEYGAVIEIRKITTNESFALKKTDCTRDISDSEGVAKQSSFIAQFTLRELHFLRSIEHPNIIKSEFIYGVEKGSDFRVYIGMELMQCTLYQLNGTNKFTHELLSFIIYQICCGVAHLEKLKIIHRDLKPSNIGVKQTVQYVDGVEKTGFVVKLLDFGMARIPKDVREKDPKMTSRVVTLNYRAPEVFLTDGEYNYPMDVWSIGCIFAELINKRKLFQFAGIADDSNAEVKALKEMVTVLGTPDETFLSCLTSTDILPAHETKDFNKIFPAENFSGRECAASKPDEKPYELSANQARDLLRKMLTFGASRRITAKQALDHPYLGIYWRSSEVDVKQAPIAPIRGLDVNVDTYKRNAKDALDDIRNLVEEEMRKHPVMFAVV